MKLSVATIIAFAALSHALPAKVAQPEKDGLVFNTLILPSIESHFSGVFVDNQMVAKEDPAEKATKRSDEVVESAAKRNPVSVMLFVGTLVASESLTILTNKAVHRAITTVKAMHHWKAIREKMTQETTLNMWNVNPDYKKYPAVACYNQGYNLKVPDGHVGKLNFEIKMGWLKTDYDCMYMTGHNSFYTWKDGGYINLSYRYDGNRCSMDKSGDLNCN